MFDLGGLILMSLFVNFHGKGSFVGILILGWVLIDFVIVIGSHSN